MRLRAVGVATITVLAAACASGGTRGAAPTDPAVTTTTTFPGQAPNPPAPDPSFTAFDGVRLEQDGRVLVLSFFGGPPGTGSCTAGYAGEATERDDEVVVRLRASFRGPGDGADACALVGYPRIVPVELATALGDRRLIDGSGGTEVGVFSLPLPTPGWLPEGWSERAEYGGARGWSVAYGSADGARSVRMRVLADAGDAVPLESTVTATTSIQGRTARWILPRGVGYEQLVLSDDRAAIVLESDGVDGPTLVRIAESLRPLPFV